MALNKSHAAYAQFSWGRCWKTVLCPVRAAAEIPPCSPLQEHRGARLVYGLTRILVLSWRFHLHTCVDDPQHCEAGYKLACPSWPTWLHCIQAVTIYDAVVYWSVWAQTMKCHLCRLCLQITVHFLSRKRSNTVCLPQCKHCTMCVCVYPPQFTVSFAWF